jgi:dihydrofolate reductase
VLTLIAALDAAGGIGLRGGIPWRCPADLRRFRDVTMGKTCVVGRKTWESIPGGLPGRDVMVISRRPHPRGLPNGLRDDPQAWQQMAAFSEAMVAGGAEVYALALPHASRLLLTRIEGEYGCDTFFPAVDWGGWECVSREGCEGATFEEWRRAGRCRD